MTTERFKSLEDLADRYEQEQRGLWIPPSVRLPLFVVDPEKAGLMEWRPGSKSIYHTDGSEDDLSVFDSEENRA